MPIPFIFALLLGMGWLTSIEFDLHITLPGDEKTGDEQEEDFNEDPEEALEVLQLHFQTVYQMKTEYILFCYLFYGLGRWKGKEFGSSC